MGQAVFLRAANVGGNNVFKPKDFAAAHPELALINVGHAGTFVSQADLDEAGLRNALEAALPVAVDMAIVPQVTLQSVVAEELTPTPGAKVEVTVFLGAVGAFDLPAQWPPVGDWEIRVVANHGWCFVTERIPGGKLNPWPSIAKLADAPTTTRAWSVMQKIAAL